MLAGNLYLVYLLPYHKTKIACGNQCPAAHCHMRIFEIRNYIHFQIWRIDKELLTGF